MSKITMQALADAAGVSRITVWKVLTHRDGVSEETRRLVQAKAEEIGYELEGAPGTRHMTGRTFSVVVSRPESAAFWMQIIHHIAKELTSYGISLMYTYLPTAYREGSALPATLENGSVDGIIVLNVYDEALLRLLAQLPLPKIFLDTAPAVGPGELQGDLVLLEGRTRVAAITGQLLDEGRRRVAFVGDVNYAQTNQDRWQGYCDALRRRQALIDPSLTMTGPIGLKSHEEEISRFLDRQVVFPEAIVCASDFIAHFVRGYLARTGRAVPDNFRLTGFDNAQEYANVAGLITTVDVQTGALGKTLARKLMFRADYPTAPYEVTYVATRVLWRCGAESEDA